jgi:hypothetical protein
VLVHCVAPSETDVAQCEVRLNPVTEPSGPAYRVAWDGVESPEGWLCTMTILDLSGIGGIARDRVVGHGIQHLRRIPSTPRNAF